MTKVRFLSLSDNSLKSSVPDGLSGLVNVEALYMSGNQFDGALQTNFLSTLTNLTELSLSDNLLTGALPSVYTGLAAINTVSFANNGFTGRPRWWG